jgi:SWI/SNF-related matrix-associated actin-dependent regulator 1 of chromatin subfamily A
VNYESLKTFFVSKINVDAKGNYKSSDIELVEAAKAFDCIIWDESHKCKEPTAQVSKICMALAMGREYRICMTGTAVVNKPKDLFTQLCIIGQLGNLFKERKYFFERYCGGYSGRGGTNLKELQSILKNTCYYRRNKSEVWQEMPAITRTVVKCEITNRQKYKDCQNDLKTYLETVGKSAKEVQRSMRAEIMVRFMKLLSIAAKGKLESVYEILSEAIENEQKYVLFADSRDVIASVFDKFKKHATFINGLLSQEQREVNKTKFLTDPECFIFVVSLKVGGTGMDGLQHVCSRGGFIQFPWHPAMSDQAEARLHRTGQKESVGFDYFLGVDTVDERVWDIIESKRGVSMQVLGSEDAAEVDTVDMINSLFDIRKNRD